MQIWKLSADGDRWEKRHFAPFPNDLPLFTLIERQSRRTELRTEPQYYVVFSPKEAKKLADIMEPIYFPLKRLPVEQLRMILAPFKDVSTRSPYATTVPVNPSLTRGHGRQYRLAISFNSS